MIRCLLLVAACCIFLSSCSWQESPKDIMGWHPIYLTDSTAADIGNLDPQPIAQGGKIYIKDRYLYQVEKNRGIHVLDIRNPEQPEKVTFIQINGAQELSIKGNLLYSNNYNDLVVIDITDIRQVALVSRTKDMFHLNDGNMPPEKGYFQCIDPDKGPVIGWERQLLAAPKCKY